MIDIKVLISHCKSVTCMLLGGDGTIFYECPSSFKVTPQNAKKNQMSESKEFCYMTNETLHLLEVQARRTSGNF